MVANNAGIPPKGMFPQALCRDRPAGVGRVSGHQFARRGAAGRHVRARLGASHQRRLGRLARGQRHGSAYAAGKGGAVAFSRQLSSEVARAGVTVNGVSLGPMDNLDMKAPHIPVGRLGSSTDVAAAEAAWVTGQTLPVNGGIVTA